MNEHQNLTELDRDTNTVIEREESRLVKICLVKYKCVLLLITFLAFLTPFIYLILGKIIGNQEIFSSILNKLNVTMY